MADQNGGWLGKIAVSIIGLVAASAGVGLIDMQTELRVLQSEKLRADAAIADLKRRTEQLVTGESGDRYLNSWAVRDFALVSDRLAAQAERLKIVEARCSALEAKE